MTYIRWWRYKFAGGPFKSCCMLNDTYLYLYLCINLLFKMVRFCAYPGSLYLLKSKRFILLGKNMTFPMWLRNVRSCGSTSQSYSARWTFNPLGPTEVQYMEKKSLKTLIFFRQQKERHEHLYDMRVNTWSRNFNSGVNKSLNCYLFSQHKNTIKIRKWNLDCTSSEQGYYKNQNH